MGNINLIEDVKADSNERGAFGLRDKLNDNKESIKESKLNSIENISTQINRENEYIEITEHDSKTNDIYKSEKDLLPKNKEISILTTEKGNILEAGRLIITVFKARDIEKKGMFGKADPYVHITLGKQKAKSKTVKNNHNPEWNFDATFEVDQNTPETMRVDVFDEDLGKDDILGHKVLDISTVLEKIFCRQSLSLLQIFNSQNRLKSMLKNNQLLRNLRKRTQNQKKLLRTLKNPYQQYKHLKNQRKK